MNKVVIFFANGMETCEALNTIDLLRRANINVVSASITGNLKISTSCKVELHADILANDIDYDSVNMLILPGGMPGTTNLAKNKLVCDKCLDFAEQGKYLAAICAAPSVLGRLGILKNRNATCYPGFEDQLIEATYINTGLVDDGNIITARALGSAFDFALNLIEKLCGKEAALNVKNSIYYNKN